MVAVDDATAAELLGRPVTSSDEAKRRLAYLLTRSLAVEGISDDLIDTLEEVLRDRPGPASPGRKLDGLLTRLGLPVPRRQPPKVEPLSEEDAKRITARFNRATRQLVQVVPHRVATYPREEMSRLIALDSERPTEDVVLSYLRRYALAIIAVLDLLGDDE